jgi:hypothetical protein
MIGQQAKAGALGTPAEVLRIPVGLCEWLFYEYVLPRLDRAHRQGVVRARRRRQRDRIDPRILECGVDFGEAGDRRIKTGETLASSTIGFDDAADGPLI